MSNTLYLCRSLRFPFFYALVFFETFQAQFTCMGPFAIRVK